VEKKQLIKLLKKSFADFVGKHGFIFYKPTILVRNSEDTLHIINFDVYTEGFDCRVAIQPLFIASEEISLSLGNRLCHLGEHAPGIWGYGNEIEVVADFEHVKELLEKVALPWFEEAGHTKGLIDFLSDEDLGSSKYKIVGLPPFMRRLILATGNLYCGNTCKAASEVMLFYELTKDETKPWMFELKKQAQQIHEFISNGDSAEIDHFLKRTIKESKSNLNIKANYNS
jgi:diadenosine tetraphosphatase ApaH/serine/threonine PP2A family protein phosphatase